jgi:hypothetical protein
MTFMQKENIKQFFRWTPSSTKIFSAFLMILLVIGYAWWPLVEEYISYFNPEISIWRQIDWLLIGNFAVMSVLITANADIKKDFPIFVIGLLGGLVIEAWGTQTELWTYYTNERPPMWIVPAWPIASLSIDRLYRLIKLIFKVENGRILSVVYFISMGSFVVSMIWFVNHTLTMSLTILSLMLTVLIIVSTKNRSDALLVFVAGSGLGYFLELWGTTRECWVYYNLLTPPIFAVFAHGMAAMAFWQVLNLGKQYFPRWVM